MKSAARSAISHIVAVLAMIVCCGPCAMARGEANVEPDFGADLLHQTNRVLEAVARDRWSDARRHAELARDPLLERYVTWRSLMHSAADHEIAEYVAFIDENPSWPLLGRLQARLEEALPEGMTTEWLGEQLGGRPPVSVAGRMAILLATAAEGRADEVKELARRIWRRDGLTPVAERKLLAVARDMLRREDHVERLDGLLWDGSWASAQRQLANVGSGHRKLADARIRLQRMVGGVDQAIARIPRNLRGDPGLAFDRMRWRRRKGMDAAAREILMDPPRELGHEKRWWSERAYQIRELLSEGRMQEAYRLAATHGQRNGASFVEAQWLAGWLALRVAGKPKEALTRFESMAEAVGTPISVSRATYWAGRAAQAMDEQEAARDWYEKAAVHVTAFYGQEATRELGRILEIEPVTPTPSTDPKTPEIEELLRLARLLCAAGAGRRALPFWRRAGRLAKEPHLPLSEAARCGRPDLAIVLGKEGVRQGNVDARLTYPIVPVDQLLSPGENGPDPALMLAVARQESHFDTSARSGAGALGLMQVMPATARAVARGLGASIDTERLMTSAELNATLGGAYLLEQLRQWDGAEYLVAVAYNAGPPRVSRWIDRFGEPRSMNRHDLVDWLELVPFGETRNYVQRILEGRAVYGSLLRRDDAWMIPPRRVLGPLVPPPVPRAKPRRS